MAGSVFDSPLFSRLFPSGEVGRLFTDTAELRAMLIVEGALARAQAARGIIPEDSAEAINRAALEIQLDPGALAQPTGTNGVSVPGMVAAFREEMNAPEHAQYLHWGATSQDILDSALMLRLRQALTLMQKDLRAILSQLAALAEAHADLPMAGRTFGQQATVTSFGGFVAEWGAPLLDLASDLEALGDQLWVSLSGAAGTAGALGDQAPDLRADLARALGLRDPERDWHTDRGPLLQITGWMGRVTTALAKIGQDVTALTQTGIGEVSIGGGSSSTMPQKQNPVAPSVLIALNAQAAGLLSTLQTAAVQRHQRDGGAWFIEWLCLPQIVLGTASALIAARSLTETLTPKPDAMARNLQTGLDMIHAEALSFALAAHLPRPDAQTATKTLCREAMETQTPLRDLVARDWPQIDSDTLFDPTHQMGQAPAAARAFATQAKARIES